MLTQMLLNAAPMCPTLPPTKFFNGDIVAYPRSIIILARSSSRLPSKS